MRYIQILLAFILLISIGSAQISELGTFRKNVNVDLLQTCGNCTFVNITSVIYPNSSQAIGNVPMTKIGTIYNYTLSKTYITQSGTYIVNGVGDVDGVNTVWNYVFFINPNGEIFDTSDSIMMMFALIVLLIVTGGFLYGAFTIPWSNPRDEEGYITKVNWYKHLKLFCIAFSYISIMWALYVVWNISSAYIVLENIASFINVLYRIMNAAFRPLFVLTIILGFVMLIKDWNLYKKVRDNFYVK